MFFIPGPGVIPLKHYGKHEVLGKIANMEPEMMSLCILILTSCLQHLWLTGAKVSGIMGLR